MKENYATEIQYQVNPESQDDDKFFAVCIEVKNYLFSFISGLSAMLKVKIVPKKD